MDLADQAETSRRGGDSTSAAVLLREAFEKERAAALEVSEEQDLEPTRSVLLRSAASLALECHELQESERLATLGLHGQPPAEIARELNLLLRAAQSAARQQPGPGLFDFVKEAGSNLFGGDDEDGAKAAADPVADPKETREAADRQVLFKLGEARAWALVRLVERLGFEVADLAVKVEGETATLKGQVASQELREKVVLAVGNVSGISRVDDRLTVAVPEPKAAFYTVVRGDTLSKIAKKRYGNPDKYMVIFEANRPMLEHPDKIYPGQVLRIPPAT